MNFQPTCVDRKPPTDVPKTVANAKLAQLKPNQIICSLVGRYFATKTRDNA